MSQHGASPPRPRQSPTGSRPSSRGPHGSPTRSRAGSASGSTPANPYGASLGCDPARDEKDVQQVPGGNKRLELPPEAYMMHPLDNSFAKRPGYNGAGKPIKVEVNQYAVTARKDNFKVYQYVITVTPMPKVANSICKKVWNHPKTQELLKAAGAGPNLWLYDNNKLAWSTTLVPGPPHEIRAKVDLDEGRPNNRGTNEFFFRMRKTSEINFTPLMAYLQGKIGWDKSVLECMNLFDHLIRQKPSQRLVPIRRNFYPPNGTSQRLDEIVEVSIGAYMAIKISNVKPYGLGLNVDVAHTAMWVGGQTLHDLATNYLETVDARCRPADIMRALSPEKKNDNWVPSQSFMHLRKLQKLRFKCPHQKAPGDNRQYTVGQWVHMPELGPKIANAHNVKVDFNGVTMSIAQYFEQRYNIRLRFPQYPLIETSKKKGCYYPMEVCIVEHNQRYPFKLSPDQTSKMIKIAVSRPAERKKKILQQANAIDFGPTNEYLQHFGIRFANKFTESSARLLKNPIIQFAGSGKIDPGTQGRWDLRGKVFLSPNNRPLKNWGLIILERSVDLNQLQQFGRSFAGKFRDHGGRIEGKPEFYDMSRQPNVAESLRECHNDLMRKKDGAPPDLFICVLRVRGSDNYERLKRSAECRFAVLTQCVAATHVVKNTAQYHSNLCMKVNAKLGGTTSRILASQPHFKAPGRTMVIGVDVSHAAPGINAPSMASLVMSMDPYASRYLAAIDTNNYRREIVTRANLNVFFKRLRQPWLKSMKQPPEHVFYFRDGVSEGQFAFVIEQEVKDMKAILKEHWGTEPKFTVIVATKRHHVRFFPSERAAGDKNGNPLPGTLVERDVTHPHHWDFYLCSHVAIQGTARPVHYHVLMDEIGWKSEELQRMIYEQSYQYMRSTTPVSLHPAVYYAHLAGNRARYHENLTNSSVPRAGPMAHQLAQGFMGDEISAQRKGTSSKPLLPFGVQGEAHVANHNYLPNTMWWI